MSTMEVFIFYNELYIVVDHNMQVVLKWHVLIATRTKNVTVMIYQISTYENFLDLMLF